MSVANVLAVVWNVGVFVAIAGALKLGVVLVISYRVGARAL